MEGKSLKPLIKKQNISRQAANEITVKYLVQQY